MAVDDLRTKIAAATVGHADYVSGLTRYCTCGQWSGDSTGTRIDFSRHLADAVIREMKMVRRSSFISEDGSRIAVSEWERSRMKTPANGWQNQYVTEWTADE